VQVEGDVPMCAIPDRGYAPYACPTAVPYSTVYATPVPCYNGYAVQAPATVGIYGQYPYQPVPTTVPYYTQPQTTVPTTQSTVPPG